MIGDNIRKFRKKKKMTQKRLGELVGVSEVMISQWERGERNPKFDNLMKICKALDIALSELIGEDDMGMYAKDILLDFTKTAQNSLSDAAKTVANIDFAELAKPAAEALEDLKDISDGERLIYYFDQLNNDGQKEAVRDVRKLTKIPEYKK